MFWGGIFSVPDETVILLWLIHHCIICGNRVYYKTMRATVG